VTETRIPTDDHHHRSAEKPLAQMVNEAPTDTAALILLAYFQARQLRTIKLVLIWTMVIVPFALVVAYYHLPR
jgi:hypothetical protein